MAETVLDATPPLNAKRLFGWHAALFLISYSGRNRLAGSQIRRQIAFFR